MTDNQLKLFPNLKILDLRQNRRITNDALREMKIEILHVDEQIAGLDFEILEEKKDKNQKV